jgi:hypothetical protein
MQLIEIKDNTFINPNQVCQIKLWNFGGGDMVGVHFAGETSVHINVPLGQNPEKFLWVIKEWIRLKKNTSVTTSKALLLSKKRWNLTKNRSEISRKITLRNNG